MATVFFTPSPPSQSSVNLCPDSPISLCSSPRISFSYNLDHHHHPSSDHHLPRSDQNLSSNDPDFDFNFNLPDCQLGHETSPADELFFNGIILPTHHIKQGNPPPPPPPQQPSSSNPKKEGDDVAEEEEEEEEQVIIVTSSTKASLIREEKMQSKSFWRFMRSSSLNCDSSSHCRKGSIWSSLPLLARSNSTGSSLQNTTKQAHGKISTIHRQSSSKQLSSSGSSTRSHHKPPLRKAQFGSPLLNVPPPYITKGTSDLLGLGSFFRNGYEKKGKKP